MDQRSRRSVLPPLTTPGGLFRYLIAIVLLVALAAAPLLVFGIGPF